MKHLFHAIMVNFQKNIVGRKKDQTGGEGGSEGGLAKDQTFSVFFSSAPFPKDVCSTLILYLSLIRKLVIFSTFEDI